MNAKLTQLLNARPGLRNVHPQIVEDALYCFSKFDLRCVQHLRSNIHRLIHHSYSDDQGNGCIFGLLSATLPEEQKIRDRSTLTAWFTGGSGAMYRELPEYQAARYLVRVWDGDRDPGTEERYDSWRGRLTQENMRDLTDIFLELHDSETTPRAALVNAAVAASVAGQ